MLEGGRTTPGVVRIGDTVRRPTGPHSPFVHRVLNHLAGKRFQAAPVFGGIDDQDREILSFIPGDVPRELGVFSDDQLTAAARLLRALHDATVDFASTMSDTVVCHGDASPCNHVFRNGLPVALIDFDAAHIGARRDDLGYAAWLWVDLGNTSLDTREQGRRLGLFFDAYGTSSSDAIDAVLDAQTKLGIRTSRLEVRRWAIECRRHALRHATVLAAGLPNHVTARPGRHEPRRHVDGPPTIHSRS